MMTVTGPEASATPLEDPIASARPALRLLRSQAEQLLSAIRVSSRSAHRGPGAVLQREAFGAIGGAITGELFGRRRIGSGLGRAYAEANRRAQILQRDGEQRAQAEALLHQARAHVNSCAPAVGPRLTESLSRILAEGAAAQRPETSIRKVIQAIGRLESFQPKHALATRPQPYPHALRHLEGALRGCIEGRLSKVSAAWWGERVPRPVRLRAEHRFAQRERVWPWLDGGNHSLVEYLGFPDYAEIILDDANWEQVFSTVFKDRDAFRVKMKELEPIRNDVFHARSIPPQNGRRLETYAEDLIAAIRSAR